jgi:hypothetical protein
MDKTVGKSSVSVATKAKFFGFGALFGLLLCAGVYFWPANNTGEGYQYISDTLGKVLTLYDTKLSNRDIEILELRKELANKPVETKIVTKIVYKEYDSSPDVEIIPEDNNTYRVAWEDPRARGYILFDGFDLRTNTMLSSYLKIYPQEVNIELVESGEEWFVAVNNDMFVVKDLSVIEQPESKVKLSPGVVVETDTHTNNHVGGTVNASIYNILFSGYYLAGFSNTEAPIWGCSAGYQSDSGVGFRAGYERESWVTMVFWDLSF